MSVVDGLDPRSREILERYGFDEELFEELRARVAAGTLSLASNTLGAKIEPLGEDDYVRLPPAGSEESERASALGREAIAAGTVAAGVLNGGMATRFGGVVKGLVEAVDGRSFLELELAEAERARTPLVVMTSFATDEPTRTFVEGRDALVFAQSVSLRLEPDGSLFRENDGSASPYSPGHGDFLGAIRTSGVLAALRERGVRTLMLSNVDNLGARIDPVVVGAHLGSGRPLTAEVTAKEPGDAGGAPARVGGRAIMVEGPRFPSAFDQDALPVFATNTFTFDLDVLDREYPLTWLYVEKEVDGRPAVQLERLVNEVTSFVPTTFLVVPRHGSSGRFFPVKTPDDLERVRPALRELVRVSAQI